MIELYLDCWLLKDITKVTILNPLSSQGEGASRARVCALLQEWQMGSILPAWRAMITTSCSPSDGPLWARLCLRPPINSVSSKLHSKLMRSETLQRRKLRFKKEIRPPCIILMLLIKYISCCIVIILFQILKQGFGCDMTLKFRNINEQELKIHHFRARSGFQSSVTRRFNFAFGADRSCEFWQNHKCVPSRCKAAECKSDAIHGS